MTSPHVIVAGGGIGGLTLALTLQQIGVDCTVYEAARELRPLGVGINLQPNAVRELFDLGLTAADLDAVGVPAREWALVGRTGHDIYAEPRGLDAGYKWPQYAVHRGEFHMTLYRKLLERGGKDIVRTWSRVTGYSQTSDGVTVRIEDSSGRVRETTADILVGADGIHSRIRARMHPAQPPVHWGGSVMWRGKTRAKPLRTGSSFVGLGNPKQRLIMYPISHVGEDGMADINWVAEVTYDTTDERDTGWFRRVEAGDFIHYFEDWKYDWLDAPALIRAAELIYENPMIDRDPVRTWRSGRVVLMGDAAHAMYPTGSNGASQAIVDARVLGAKLIEHGVTEAALAAYDDELCGPVSQLVLRNREAGPFGLLAMVEERCKGAFDDIDTVIPADERAAFMAGYKTAAGFEMETLNAAPPIIPKGAAV